MTTEVTSIPAQGFPRRHLPANLYPPFNADALQKQYPLYNHFLIHCLQETRDRIDIDNLQVYLLSEGCMRENDQPKLKVSSERSLSQVVVDLVLMIKRNGHEDRFLKALRRSGEETNHSGHRELVGILEEERKKQHAEEDHTRHQLRDLLSPAIGSDPVPVYPKLSTGGGATRLLPSGGDVETDTVRAEENTGSLVQVTVTQQQQQQNPPQPQPSDPGDQQQVQQPHELKNRPPYSWKPFLIGMLCMGLIAGGVTLIVTGVRGTCTLSGKSRTSALHAFNAIFGLLCLSMPVLWIILLVRRILKEYNHFPSVRKLLYGGALIWFVLCILAAITELVFSFFVAGPIYDNFSNVINDNNNSTSSSTSCSGTVFITSFVSLTLVYVLAFVLLAIFILYLFYRGGTAALKKHLEDMLQQVADFVFYK